MKKLITLLIACAMLICSVSCGEGNNISDTSTLVYGCSEITRINPAMDEHGEINLLLFDGLTAHDGSGSITSGLAKSWKFDSSSCTYTFYLKENVQWHDGEAFTADDVKFTIEAIIDPDNGSENAPDFEDVEYITIADKYTITFKLASPNAAFLDYMTIPILPKHLLEGEDMQRSDFFRSPVGTGPYKLESWDEGQAITLVKNESYFKGAASIERIIFKIVPDNSARTLQMQSGELDLALLSPASSRLFEGNERFAVYNMQTSDYRGIMFNFNSSYWEQNADIIPAVCCSIDREAIVDAVLLGHGEAAYSPLQRNIYNNEDAENYGYDPERAKQILEGAGCTMSENGFYERGGEEIGFVLSVPADDQVRLDIAMAAAQQLREIGINCTVEVVTQIDWSGQQAYLIGWGSPFDADCHTYKVFGSGKSANYSGYSNEEVDKYLIEARQTSDTQKRKEAYCHFQNALAERPAFAFICYIDADYVASSEIHGIDSEAVMGHHGVGIFWNVTEWSIGV